MPSGYTTALVHVSRNCSDSLNFVPNSYQRQKRPLNRIFHSSTRISNGKLSLSIPLLQLLIHKYSIKKTFNELKRSFLRFLCSSAFVLERGRVALRLNTTDVLCKKVYFNPIAFQSNEGKINVQTSINDFNSTGSFIHDAAVTCVESVTHLNFKLCALKAGRAERLTPDGGLTFVDCVAIQESLAGAIAGHLQMPMKWWDGTTCKKLDFQQVR